MKIYFYAMATFHLHLILIGISMGTMGSLSLYAQTHNHNSAQNALIDSVRQKQYVVFDEQAYITAPDGLNSNQANEIMTSFVTNNLSNDAYHNRLTRLHTTVRNSSTWQQVHYAVQQYIEETQQLPIAFVEHQQLSQGTLRGYLLREETTPELQQALEYYMNVLIKYKSFGPKTLLAHTLLKLRGHWTNEQISAVAQHILDSTKIFMENGRKPTTVNEFFYTIVQPTVALRQEYKKLSSLDQTMMITKAADTLCTQYQEFVRQYPRKRITELTIDYPAIKNNSTASAQNYLRQVYGIALLSLLANNQER
jgi:hypothetical protein